MTVRLHLASLILVVGCTASAPHAQADRPLALSRSSSSVVALGTVDAVLDVVEVGLRERDSLMVLRGRDTLGVDGINIEEACPGGVNVATIRATRVRAGRVRVTTESAFKLESPLACTNLAMLAWGALNRASVPAVIEPVPEVGVATCRSVDEQLVEAAGRLAALPDSTTSALAGEVAAQVEETPPELVRGFDAFVRSIRYPQEARRADAEGRTYVRFVVDEQGRPTCIEMLVGLHPALNAEALRAVRAARFRPATQAGRAVSMPMTLPLTFNLR